MLSPHILAFAFALAPSLVSAALFPPDSLVKMIDAKGFKKAMKENETSLVAFVAPWCGHCQNLVPEYGKVALGLYPLVPTYAVDCDAEKNKQLCAEQGVQGFPTIKIFPRGNALPPVLYDDRRTSSAIYYFAIRTIPKAFTKIFQHYDISPWLEKHQSKHRAFLLRKDKKTPLLWQVLANKYQGQQLEFATIPDRKGKISVQLGLEAGEKKVSKVLLYPAGSTNFIVYEGIQKLDSLSKFLDTVLNGTADLSTILEEVKAEEFVVDDRELEIEQQQEAQRIALMHGGFTNLIDFEAAIKSGGANYHDTHGYAGVMGGIPEHLKKKPSDAPSDTEGQTATPHSAQKEDEIVVEQISEQVILEVKNDAPVGCQGKDNAPSDGEQSSCTTERPKDEL